MRLVSSLSSYLQVNLPLLSATRGAPISVLVSPPPLSPYTLTIRWDKKFAFCLENCLFSSWCNDAHFSEEEMSCNFSYFRTFIRIHWYTVPPTSAILYGKVSSITMFDSNGYNIHDTTIYTLVINRHFIFYFISYCFEYRFLVRPYEMSA